LKVTISQDSEWKDKRKKRWENVWENGLRVIGISKQEKKEEDLLVAAYKQWYLEGDLTPLIQTCKQLNSQQELGLRSVLKLCPITDLDVYLQFIEDYSIWLSENEISYWESSMKDRDVKFIKSFFALYKNDHLDSTQEIYLYMINTLIPDEEGVVTFPFPLGADQWQPRQEMALCDYSSDLLTKLRRYLFGSVESALGYGHLKDSVPQIKYIVQLDSAHFDTKLLDDKPKRPPKPPKPRKVSNAGQTLIRAEIGNILGYKNDFDKGKYEGPLRHNDPEVEKQLKDLIDSLDMPEEYYRLVDFIKAHPDDFVTRSE